MIFGFLLPENDEQNYGGCLNFNPRAREAYPHLIKVLKKSVKSKKKIVKKGLFKNTERNLPTLYTQ